MIQHLLILIVFLVAVAYMGRMIYRSFAAKSGCAKGCGSCGGLDFNKIQKEMEKRKAVNG